MNFSDVFVQMKNNKIDSIEKTCGPIQKNNLPSGWYSAKLRGLCEEGTIVNPERTPNEYFSYVDVSSVSNQYYNIIDTKEIKGEDAPSRARKQIKTDDVIFATVRPALRRVALVPSELNNQICSTGFCVLRAKKDFLNPKYIYFYLLTDLVNQYVASLEKGATYPAINDSELLNLFVPVPPLPEQRAIAHALQTVQQAIQARRKELELERELKAALMEHLFTHGTRNEPTKLSEVGEIPESWEILKLSDVVTLQRGFDITTKEQRLGTVPVVSSSGISSYHDTAAVKGPGVVIGRKGTLGTVFYVEDDYWPHDTTLWVKDFHSNDPRFIYYLLKTIKVTQFNVGASNPTLNRNHIANLWMKLPKQNEQNEIVNILSAYDTKIAALEKEITLHEELFRTLLDELMTGRLSTLPLIAQLEKGNLTHGQRTPDSTGTTH